MTSRILPLSDGHHVHMLAQGRGEPLVLIHGVGMQAAAWGPQVAHFADRYRVIAVDMPGHGGSARLGGTPGLADYVRWMIEVIETLDVGPVNLAGHSMGALIAGGVAIERPALVRRLAVVNGVHRRSDAARAAVVARAEQLRDGHLDIDTPLQRWFDVPDAPPALVETVRGWLEQVDLQGYADAYRAFARGDLLYADRWCEVQCPTLALTGADDLNSTGAMAERMAGLAARGHAVILEGQRHMVNLTAPDLVNRAMSDWLAAPP
ncbi:alpha/beta hydrolase [Luteimonas sp. TWI1416]|uniref:alpha/beta fold hydrolase n=1 Tax=unclassified Luteimonas TaxID=2629088 RepID=UPI003208E200